MLGLLEVLLNEDPSYNFPALAGCGERVEVGEYEVVFPSLLFKFDVSFEYFCVFLFDFVVMLGHFLGDRHKVDLIQL